MTKISNQYSLTNILTADLANSRLGINNVSPAYSLDLTGTARVSTSAYLATASGSVGIGTTTIGTDYKLAIYGTNSMMTFQNVNTGQTNGDGFAVGSFGNVDAYLYNYENANMIFGTNATERMRIKNDGQVIIGDSSMLYTNAEGHPFGVKSTGGQCFISLAYAGQTLASGGLSVGITGVAAYFFVRDYVPIIFATGNNERIRITNTGNLLLGTTTDSGYKLYVNGTSAGTSAFQNVSDGRFKKDITPIENALNKVKQLNGVSFNWDKTSRPDLSLDDKNHLGLIAQDVEEILPQVVTTGIDELKTKTITYSDIVPVLIEAIKELSAEITLLKNK